MAHNKIGRATELSNTLSVEQPMLRGSEISTFKRCPWRWYHYWVLGLTPKVEKKDALWVGTGVHLAMAEYYVPGVKRGRHPRETWEEYCEDTTARMRVEKLVDDDFESGVEDVKQVIGEVLDEYVIHHGGDPSWEVLAPEQRFTVNIPRFRYEPTKHKWVPDSHVLCRFTGTYDLPIRDLTDGQIKIVDHKTAKQIVTYHLTMDAQASGYCAVGTHTLRELGLIGAKEVVSGMIYNFIRKGKIDARPKNEQGLSLNLNGTVSKKQPTPLFQRIFIARNAIERNNQVIRISHDAERILAARASAERPGGTDNLLKVFQRDCYYCPFYDLCELDESGGDTGYFIENVYKTVDPYADHQEGAENSKIGVTKG